MNSCSMVATGTQVVASGISKWSVQCFGEYWAIGIIGNKRLEVCAEDNSMDFPFVGGDCGRGVGLVKGRGSIYLSAPGYSVPWYDRDLSSAVPEGATEFGIVLDMSRACIFFEAEGKRIPGSWLGAEHIDIDDRYRFVANLPEPKSSVKLMP